MSDIENRITINLGVINLSYDKSSLQEPEVTARGIASNEIVDPCRRLIGHLVKRYYQGPHSEEAEIRNNMRITEELAALRRIGASTTSNEIIAHYQHLNPKPRP